MAGLPLVTGATGFAGSHLLDLLLADLPGVAAWANPSGHAVTNDDPRIAWDAVDLVDGDQVARAIGRLRPTEVYHCAGLAHLVESHADPERALRVNVLATHHLLAAVSAAGLSCRVLITGSALIYRHASDAIREDHPIGPSSPYGVSKLAQEMLAFRETATAVIVARPFNHAGPRQDPSYVTSSFARQIAEIEAGRREPVLRVGNLDSRRDITDVRDTVRAYRLLMERGVPGRAYNVCSGHAYRIGDLLDRLVSRSRAPITIEPDAALLRPSDNPIILGDCSRITAETGWTPRIPIERTLDDLLDYWRTRSAHAAGPA